MWIIQEKASNETCVIELDVQNLSHKAVDCSARPLAD